MRYSAEHKADTRQRLLEVAGAVAKRDGFATTGVDGLAAAAGLTSGAFYSHFRSKAEMLCAVVENELTRSLERFSGRKDEQMITALASYLSLRHVERPDQGCAVTSLSAEVARSTTEARQTFERMLLAMREAVRPHVADEKAAWVMIAQLVGAVTIARAMASEGARRSLLEAVLEQSTTMVGAATRQPAAPVRRAARHVVMEIER
jgi:TetR/AcrR family transcriptional regulator, transcriptional repressor for nem operon